MLYKVTFRATAYCYINEGSKEEAIDMALIVLKDLNPDIIWVEPYNGNGEDKELPNFLYVEGKDAV